MKELCRAAQASASASCGRLVLAVSLQATRFCARAKNSIVSPAARAFQAAYAQHAAKRAMPSAQQAVRPPIYRTRLRLFALLSGRCVGEQKRREYRCAFAVTQSW